MLVVYVGGVEEWVLEEDVALQARREWCWCVLS